MYSHLSQRLVDALGADASSPVVAKLGGFSANSQLPSDDVNAYGALLVALLREPSLPEWCPVPLASLVYQCMSKTPPTLRDVRLQLQEIDASNRLTIAQMKGEHLAVPPPAVALQDEAPKPRKKKKKRIVRKKRKPAATAAAATVAEPAVAEEAAAAVVAEPARKADALPVPPPKPPKPAAWSSEEDDSAPADQRQVPRDDEPPPLRPPKPAALSDDEDEEGGDGAEAPAVVQRDARARSFADETPSSSLSSSVDSDSDGEVSDARGPCLQCRMERVADPCTEFGGKALVCARCMHPVDAHAVPLWKK